MHTNHKFLGELVVNLFVALLDQSQYEMSDECFDNMMETRQRVLDGKTRYNLSYEYEIVDFGPDYVPFFEGIGLSSSNCDYVTYGIGVSFNDALGDMLECLSQEPGIKPAFLGQIYEKENISQEENNKTFIINDDCDVMYHLGIRFSFNKD